MLTFNNQRDRERKEQEEQKQEEVNVQEMKVRQGDQEDQIAFEFAEDFSPQKEEANTEKKSKKK